MAFVNEYISPEDFERYRLHERDEAHGIGATHSDNWTIDRERNMILRLMGKGREELAGQIVFAFFWNGVWTRVRVQVIDGGGGKNAPQWLRCKLLGIEPHHVAVDRTAYLKDLTEALTAFRGAGVRADASEFTAILDV